MSKTLFTSLSPNTEKDDILLAVSLIFRPWLWERGGAIAEVEKYFQTELDTPYCFGFESGRTALTVALRALGIGEGDEVLIQAYTCVAVVNSVLWAGAKPVFVDIDSTLNMDMDLAEQKVSEKTKAVIIQNTFGNPADMGKVMELASKHKIKIIEDCAHALGSQFDGKKIGTFGDAVIFSFGRDKVVSSVFGGMLVCKNSQTAGRIKEIRTVYKYPSKIWILRQLLHPIILWKAKIFYNWFGLGKVILEIAKRLGLITKAVYPEERIGGKPDFIGKIMPNAMAMMTLKQLKKLDRYIDHRKKIAKIYDEELIGCSGLQKQEQIKTGEHTFLRYTVFTNESGKLLAAAKREKIFLGDWYRQVIAPAGVDYTRIGYIPGSCPRAERFAEQSVNLPTSIQIAEGDAKRVAQIVINLLCPSK
ncbi:MAG: DegT/DnrJ/EryC1/StrS family aminotransferase [Patescibacteria group bacterium]